MGKRLSLAKLFNLVPCLRRITHAPHFVGLPSPSSNRFLERAL